MGVSSQQSQYRYLVSIPGGIRITNCLLGLFCIVLSSIGFNDDFRHNDSFLMPYITFYGLGYKEENANSWSLILLSFCFVVSTIFLMLLVNVDNAILKWKSWNRFLNLFLTIVHVLGWICGLMGLLLFRQGCCHVEITNSDRVPFDNDGYLKPCLCIITPHNDPDNSYPILIYQDAPIGVKFLNARPHHYNGHFISLILMFCNIFIYAGAVWKV